MYCYKCISNAFYYYSMYCYGICMNVYEYSITQWDFIKANIFGIV